MSRKTKRFVGAFAIVMSVSLSPFSCCLAGFWQAEQPWLLQSFDLDSYELRIIATPNLLSDPIPLSAELRRGGRIVGEAVQLGRYDDELRFEARRYGREGVIIVTERRRQNVVWYVYDPSANEGWPASEDGTARTRLLTLARRCRGDECVFCDDANGTSRDGRVD